MGSYAYFAANLDIPTYAIRLDTLTSQRADAQGRSLFLPPAPIATVSMRLARITTLRAKGVGWKRIAAELKVGVGTLYQRVSYLKNRA